MHYDPDTGIYTIGSMQFRRALSNPSRWERYHLLTLSQRPMWMLLAETSTAVDILDYLEQNNHFTHKIDIGV